MNNNLQFIFNNNLFSYFKYNIPKLILSLAVFILMYMSFLSSIVFAQTYNMNTSTQTTCSGTFYDPGGTGNYANSQNFTMTIQPNACGKRIRVTFTSFNTESGYDFLRIYNANNATNIIGTYSGTQIAVNQVFTATNFTGALTFNFTSDGSVVAAGWVATITCEDQELSYMPQETAAAPTNPSACATNTANMGPGSWQNFPVSTNTDYTFTLQSNPAGATVSAFVVYGNNGTTVLGNSSGGTVTVNSGANTNLKVLTCRAGTWAVTANLCNCYTNNQSSAVLNYRRRQPGAVTVSGGGAFCAGITQTLTASGGANGTMYWQNTSATGTSVATPSTSQSVSSTGTYYFGSSNGGSAGCWTYGSATSTSTAAPGNPANFGSNTWNVYAYNGGNIDLNGVYSGYYTEPSLSYSTQNRWSGDGTPSSASGFQGCGTPVPIDYHAVVSKRQGFPCGVYQIDVPTHDDDMRVYINGTLVWSHEPGCCDEHLNIWTGYLTSTSTIEVRHLEGVGGSHQALTFVSVIPTLSGGTIGGITNDVSICSGTDPGAFTNTGTPSGGTIGVDNGSAGGNPAVPTYQWEQSTTSAVAGWGNAASTGLTFDPGNLTLPTWYRRKVTDACGNVAYSNVIKVNIFNTFSPGAIQNTGQTVCYNGDPSVIGSSSAASGGNGSYTYEWRENGTPIPSSNSLTYDPPGGQQSNKTYTRWARDGACNTSFVQSTNSWVVTVRPQFTPGAILTTGQTICNGGTPSVIGNSVVASGGDATITYSWRSSADGYTAAIGGATASTYTPPAGLTTTTSYRRYARDGTCNTTPEVSTGTWTVTVQSVPNAGTIGNAQTICNNTTPGQISSNAAGTGDGSITYRWERSTTSAVSGFGTVAGTAATFDPPALTATTWYRRITISTLNSVACESISNVIEITVQSVVAAGTIASAQTICYNTTPAAITSSVNGSGSGSITYRWEVSTTSAVAGFSDLGNTTAGYSPGALTQDHWYKRFTISTLNGNSCEAAAAVILKKVQSVPTAGTIGADRTICNNTTTTISSSSAGTGRSGAAITYRWEVSTTSDVAGFSNAGVATAAITTPTLTVDTWYRRITIATLDGTPCESAPTTATKVTVQSIPTAGAIETDQTICYNTSPATITSTTAGTGDGTIAYRWERDPGTGYVTQAGTGATLSPGNLIVTTLYRRYSRSTLNGNTCDSPPTSPVQITVQSTPVAGSIAADQTICNNTTPATLTSSANGTGDGSITYRWQSSTTSAVAGFSDNGTVTASFSPSALTQDTWYRRYTVSTLNSVACESTNTAVVKITVQAVPGAGSIGTDQTICYNTTPNSLTNTSVGTGTGTISYIWEQSSTDANTNFSVINGQTNSTYAPGALTANRWYRRSTLSTLNSNECTSVTTSAVQITVRPQFTPGSILTTGETICSNNNPVQIDNNVAASGGDNSITYEWRANGNPIGSTNVSSYDPPAVAVNTTYTRWAKDATCNTSFEQSAGSWVVTVTNPSVVSSLANNDYVWTGLNGTDWATTTNWLQWNSSTSSYAVPSSYPNSNTANVILPQTSTCVLNNAVTNSSTLSTNNLTIENGHVFAINDAVAILNIAGTLTVNGTWTTPTAGSTVNFNGAGSQTIPVLSYSNLGTATGGTKTLAGNLTVSRVLTIGASSTLNLSTYTLNLPFVGTPLVNSGTFTASTGKVDFNGAGNQSLAGLNYYNLTTSGSGTKTLVGNTAVANTLALEAGTLTIGANTFTLNGSILTRTNGTIDASNSSATLVFNNGSDLTLPANVFSAAVQNLTLSNAKVKASTDFTVNGTLYLNHANPNATDGLLDLVQDYGSYANSHSANSTDSYNNLNSVVLTLGPNASTDGNGDVTGKIRRTSLSDGLTYTFGNKNMTVKLDANGGSLPSSLTVVATKGDEGLHVDKDGTADFTPGTSDTLIGGAAVKRLHQILRTDGTSQVRFTVRFPYDDSELNGNSEADLVTWDHHIPYGGLTPHEHGKTSIDNTENYVELANHGLFYLAEEGDAGFTKYWMLSKKVTLDTLWLGASGGAAGTDWSNGINWTAGVVPSNWTKIVVDGNIYKSELTITGNRQAATMEIKPSAIVHGGSGKLTLNGGPQNNGGTGTWVNNGTFDPGTSEIIINNDDATMAGNTRFYDLTINSGKKLTIQTNAVDTISGMLTNNGTFDAALNENTIVYNGEYQTIFQPNGNTAGYHNLTINQANGATAYAAEQINTKGNLRIEDGAFDLDGNLLEIKGNLINNASLSGAPLVTMSGTTTQLIGGTSPINFNNLMLTGIDTVKVQNNIAINGELTVDSDKKLAGGNSEFEFYNSDTPFILGGEFIAQTSTVKYLSTDPTNIASTTYYNLTASEATTKTALGNLAVLNQLEIDASTLDIDNFTLTIEGSGGNSPIVANGGGIDADAGEVIFNNSDNDVSLPAGFFVGEVKDMTVIGGMDVELNDDLTITGTLDANDGDILLGSNLLVMESNSTWTKTNGQLDPQTGRILYKSANFASNILPSNTVSNLEFSRPGPIQIFGDLEVSGEFKMTEADLDIQNYTLKLSGDMIYIDGQIDADNGKVDFNNADVLNLPSAFFAGDIKALKLSGAGGIGLARDSKVTHELSMDGGNINMGSHTLEIGVNKTQTGDVNWTSGTVVGEMKRWFKNTINSTQESGIFPVGTSEFNRYAQINFTSAPEGGYLKVKYVEGLAPDTYSNFPIQYFDPGNPLRHYIQNADEAGYWEMTPYDENDTEYGALDNTPYNLFIRLNNPSSVQNGGVLANPPRLRIIRAKGEAGGGHSDWQLAGTHQVIQAFTAGSDYKVGSGDVVGFSWFNGGGDNANPLPVELISFSGKCNDESTIINWKTASEFNSSYYLLEKSTDGENWRNANNQSAAGFSTEELTYEYIDISNIDQAAYYRLTQVDINGDTKVYDPIFVSCNENNNVIKTLPNPSSSEFKLFINDKNLVGKATLNMVDTKGTIVSSISITIEEGSNLFFINENVAPGIYYINVSNDTYTSEVIKHSIR